MNASPLTMLKPKFPLAIYHLIVVNVMGPYIDCHFKQLKAFLGLWYGLQLVIEENFRNIFTWLNYVVLSVSMFSQVTLQIIFSSPNKNVPKKIGKCKRMKRK